MIRVLVVDDSQVQRELLIHILQSDPDIQVIDTANSGLEAINKIAKNPPDIITMDIHMPNMNGIEAIKKIMSIQPLPIIVVTSSCLPNDTVTAFEAIEAGALAILDKTNFAPENRKEITDTIKIMSEVKVVRRYAHLTKSKSTIQSKIPSTDINDRNIKNLDIRLIGIGASTGGPTALQDIFNKIHPPFSPILVVQHIPTAFLEGLVEWLAQTTHQQIKIAKQDEVLEKDWIYFAPNDYQMGIQDRLAQAPQQFPLKVMLNKEPPDNGHRPSASYLFRSMANVLHKQSLGILLTGMGRDGAEGLKLMKDQGATTIAQDESSSVIYGMPGEAVILGAAQLVMNPEAIAKFVNGCHHEQ